MTSWLAGLVRRVSFGTFLTLGLLGLADISLSLAISEIVRGLEASLTMATSFFAVMMGWFILGWVRKPLLSLLSGVMIGVVYLFLRLGQLSAQVFSLFRLYSVYTLPGASPETILRVLQTDPVTLQQTTIELCGHVQVMGTRLWAWLQAILQGSARYDPFTNAFFWCFLIWVGVYWGSWATRRGYGALPAMLPALVLLGTCLAYTNASIRFLGFLLTATLFLTVLGNYRKRERCWLNDHLDFSEDIRFDIAWVGTGVVLVVTLAAVSLPSISVQAIADQVRFWSQRQGIEPDNAALPLGLQPRPVPPENLPEYYHPGLPREHLLGSGPELSQEIVMEIRLETIPLPTDLWADGELFENVSRGIYWRGLTYDVYTGHGWRTSAAAEDTYPANHSIQEIDPVGYRFVKQEVRELQETQQLVHTAGPLTTVNRRFTAIWRPDADLFGATHAGSTYQAAVWIPVFERDELAAAVGEIPQWIRDRYLRLPSSVPGRVLGLARDLTAGESSAYDQALALEAYLREFPYTLDLPVPPANQDVVDFFLFDLERGYCDYYATAMVVLARAVGLPARLATGYATGAFNEATGIYVISQAEAHSWPEIYFPGFGWVPFEPTASRPASIQESGLSQDYGGGNLPELDNHLPDNPPVSRATANAVWIALLIGGAFFLFLAFKSRAILGRRPLSQHLAKDLFRSIRRMAWWWNVPVKPGDTPLEFLDRFFLTTGIDPGISDSIHQPESSASSIKQIVLEAFYAPRPPDPEIQLAGKQIWDETHLRLWWMGLAKRLQLLFIRGRSRHSTTDRTNP